jgi:hypothetical protein
MKTLFFNYPKTLSILALATAGVLAVPQSSEAKPKDKHKHKHSSRASSHHRSYRDDDRHDHRHRSYYSHPRSSFVLSLGSGYAGRGYYYGPPGASYYYQSPGVRYYATRSVVPREYLGGGYGSSYGGTDAAVQSELARRGYYNGPIDGDIGPGSSRAIARYQMDRGLPVTGSITSSLLRSLGL